MLPGGEQQPTQEPVSETQEQQPPQDDKGQQTAPQDPMARSYEDLSRRDRELTERHQRIREQEKSLQELQEIRQLAQRDPDAALQRLGGDPSQIGASLFGAQPQAGEYDEVTQLRSELKTLNERLEKAERGAFETQEGARIRGIVESGDFEVLQLSLGENPQQVTQEILQEAALEYRETGRVPDYRQIAVKLEDRYLANAVALIQRLSSATKVKSKLGTDKPTPGTDKPTSQQAEQQPASQGLTNALEDTPSRREEPLGTGPEGIEARRAAFLKRLPLTRKPPEK